MFKRVRTWLFIGSLLSVAHPAFAQDWADPEGGEEGDSSSWNAPTNAPPPANTPPPAAAPRSNPPASNWGNADAPANEEAPQTSGTSDHAKYAVGHVGVGFFGITSIPYGFGSFDYTPTNITGGGRPTAGSLSAPTLGVRWWLSELLALEGAIGIGLTSNSIDAAGTSLDGDSNFGFAVHLGAPLALYHSGHYKFLIIPELNFGYADGSRPSSTPAAAGETDLLSGMLLQV
ncbi:MAG: hypothetical protein KC417_02090, partial [Myxococcales bacterium]|nr:hypothetical protein [Myxococcales bacterium]